MLHGLLDGREEAWWKRRTRHNDEEVDRWRSGIFGLLDMEACSFWCRLFISTFAFFFIAFYFVCVCVILDSMCGSRSTADGFSSKNSLNIAIIGNWTQARFYCLVCLFMESICFWFILIQEAIFDAESRGRGFLLILHQLHLSNYLLFSFILFFFFSFCFVTNKRAFAYRESWC